jgi:hypothetical protein
MIILDSLSQEISIGDIIMLALLDKDMNRNLEPAMLKSFYHHQRPDSKLTCIKLLINNREKKSIIEFDQHEISEKESDVKFNSVIKILNPEFFLHDEKISILLSQRPAILTILSSKQV